VALRVPISLLAAAKPSSGAAAAAKQPRLWSFSRLARALPVDAVLVLTVPSLSVLVLAGNQAPALRVSATDFVLRHEASGSSGSSMAATSVTFLHDERAPSSGVGVDFFNLALVQW
jgi:hypothetical protein